MVLASSFLMRRTDRQRELLEAADWDLICWMKLTTPGGAALEPHRRRGRTRRHRRRYAPRPFRSAPWHTSVRSSTNSVPTLSLKAISTTSASSSAKVAAALPAISRNLRFVMTVNKLRYVRRRARNRANKSRLTIAVSLGGRYLSLDRAGCARRVRNPFCAA
jgi:hypothetical protein